MQKLPHATYDSPLAASCMIYSRILGLMGELQMSLERCSASEISGFVEILGRLQADAAALDQQIDAEALSDPAAAPLASRRDELLATLLTENRKLHGRARQTQTLYAHEMTGLRQGFSALQGYRPPQRQGGELVNSSR